VIAFFFDCLSLWGHGPGGSRQAQRRSPEEGEARAPPAGLARGRGGTIRARDRARRAAGAAAGGLRSAGRRDHRQAAPAAGAAASRWFCISGPSRWKR